MSTESVTITFGIHGDEHPLALPGSSTLGEAKQVVVDQFGLNTAPVTRWEVRDARDGFMLNESTLLSELVERDRVNHVLVCLPPGAGGG